MAVPQKLIAPYAWDGKTWSMADSSKRDSVFGTSSSTLRLATMNILTDTFPWLMRLAIASHSRFQALVHEISRLDATMLALQEVSQTGLQSILASEFVRQNYYVTELPNNVNGTLSAPFTCILLSKLPLEECYAFEPLTGEFQHRYRLPVVGVVRACGKRIAVCSLHTVAYQTEHNKALRAKQIANAVMFVRSLDVQAAFIVGDLNMHYLAEDAVITANGLLDCWAETHFGPDGDGDPGFTFNALTNRMIEHYIPGERRRMRLDRILCVEGGALEPCGKCMLWGHAPVDARRDIYLSDHYGLVVNLTVAGGCGFSGSADVRSVLESNGLAKLGDNPFSVSRLALALLRHSVWLVARLIGLR